MSGISHFLSYFESGIWDGICKVGYAKRGFSSWSNRFRRGQVGTAGLAGGNRDPGGLRFFAGLVFDQYLLLTCSEVSISPSPSTSCHLPLLLLPLNHQHTSLCGPSERTALRLAIHTTPWTRYQQSHLHPTVTQGAYHKLYLLHYKPFLVDCGPLVNIG